MAVNPPTRIDPPTLRRSARSSLALRSPILPPHANAVTRLIATASRKNLPTDITHFDPLANGDRL